MQNIKNWKAFYEKDLAPTDPTPFVKFAKDYLEDERIVDIGCGNARDTKYLKKQGFDAVGIDPNSVDPSVLRVPFQEFDFKRGDTFYSRFFLHSISDEDIIDLLGRCYGRFIAEFRIRGDEPKIYKHKRNFIDPSWFFAVLYQLGFDIVYGRLGRRLAPYKGEDPLVMRIIMDWNE